MIKRHAGKKMNSEETQEYMEFTFKKELKDLQTKLLDIPSKATFVKVMDDYHTRKTQCLISHSCAGLNYAVFDGVFDSCGKMNPFEVWNRYVDETKCEKDIYIFMDHYDIPPFEAPERGRMTINAFFQAKYGMFYCYDNNKRYGLIDYDPSLIITWERN
jgi:lantibiotic modifying enzyme